VILNRGKLVAQGSVQDLLATRSGRARYVVEAEGEGIQEGLAALPGVEAQESTLLEGRTRVQLEGSGDNELRPEIFALARDRGWTLWELHRERASLEDVFRQLTSEREEVGR
jgi:ABC-2 type transport system ATP-binding protein